MGIALMYQFIARYNKMYRIALKIKHYSIYNYYQDNVIVDTIVGPWRNTPEAAVHDLNDYAGIFVDIAKIELEHKD